MTSAFSLSTTAQSLIYHFDDFKNDLEVINHDCMDFVFYQDKSSQKNMRVLSFIEQNDQFKF